MLDCISGGRLVAGVPLGLGCDANISYGITPMDQRERWREAIDLMLKAWTAKEFFAWNGKYYQLPKVNLWPRPVQDPHPPLLVPGAASSSTWDYCHDRDLPYAYLSYFGGKSAYNVMDRFWERAAAKGKDANPYRASFLQLVGVAETDRKAEEEYAKHVEYFYHKLLHQPTYQIAPPGYSDYKSLLNVLKAGKNLLQFGDLSIELKPLKAKDMIANEFVVIGSPATVRDKLEAMAKRLNVGHLMVVLQFGSMPHHVANKNIELFGREVLPHLQKIWEDQAFENALVAEEAAQPPGQTARDGDGLTARPPIAARSARRAARSHPSHSLGCESWLTGHQDDPDQALQLRGKGEDRRQRSAAGLSASGGGPIWDRFRRGPYRALHGLCAASSRHRRNAREFDLFGREPLGSGADLRRDFRRAWSAFGAGDRHLVRRHDGVRARRAPARADQQDGAA